MAASFSREQSYITASNLFGQLLKLIITCLVLFNSEGFTHLKIYEISYMWNAAISCMFTFVVGMIVSMFTKPQNPKTLNPDLISPALYQIFKPWPKQVNEYITSLQIGSEYVRQFCNFDLILLLEGKPLVDFH
jgi:hypothetical protein